MLTKTFYVAQYICHPRDQGDNSDSVMYDDIENDSMLLNPHYAYYVMLAGDLNARTRSLHDFVLCDYNLFHEINIGLAIAGILEDEHALEILATNHSIPKR